MPGSLKVRRRAPALYQKLLKGLYPSIPEKGGYNKSQIGADGAPIVEGVSSKDLTNFSNGDAKTSLSVLPKRQRKRFFLPGKFSQTNSQGKSMKQKKRKWNLIQKKIFFFSFGLSFCIRYCSK